MFFNGSQNKQRLFPHTPLTDRFLQPGRSVPCAVQIKRLYIIHIKPRLKRAVTWLRWVAIGFSRRKHGLNSRSFHVRFVVNKVVLRQGFLRVLLFWPVIVIQPMLFTYLHLHAAPTRRANGRTLRNLKKAMLFRKSWNTKQKNTFAWPLWGPFSFTISVESIIVHKHSTCRWQNFERLD